MDAHSRIKCYVSYADRARRESFASETLSCVKERCALLIIKLILFDSNIKCCYNLGHQTNLISGSVNMHNYVMEVIESL